MLRWFYCFFLFFSACTYNTYETIQGDDMPTPGGILDKQNVANIGQTLVLTNNATAAAGGANIRFIPKVDASENGSNTVVREFGLPDFPSLNGANPETLALTVDNYQTTNEGVAEVIQLQLVLTWKTGTALFGVKQEANVAFPGLPSYHSEVAFDLQGGATIALPAATYVSAKIRYTATTNLFGGGAFATGDVLGPAFRVNYGFSYYPTNNGVNTFTDAPISIPPSPDPAFNTSGVTKAKYATAIGFTWQKYQTAKPLHLDFISVDGTFVWQVNYDPSINGILPVFLPWPNGAVAVRLTNSDAALTMAALFAIQQLSL